MKYIREIQRIHPRTLILLTLVVAAVVCAIYGLVWAQDQSMERERVEQSEKLRIESYNNLSKEEKAILRAETYVADSIHITDTSERIFFSYLQRKYDLGNKIGVSGPPMDLHEDPRTYPEHLHFLARVAYPDRIVNTGPKQSELDDPIKITNIYSANCDHLTLPPNFWPSMEKSIQDGSYYLTHVALAFEFMKDNGCALHPTAQDMSNRVNEGMVKLADDPGTVADLRYEAVAFLLMRGEDDLVKPEWINQIVEEQREDGGWTEKVGGSKNSPHATLLAMWSLLEYSRPNTPDEPLIRRPSNTGQNPQQLQIKAN